jgi:CRP-like cAMP-binding protein
MAFKFELEWRIGRYPIIRDIGRGATSRVYLARDPASGRDVAVKVYFLEEGIHQQAAKLLRKAFLAESALAGRLIHPHIVQIFDAGTDTGYSYVVMEYVQGTTLEAYCDVTSLLPLPKVVEVIFKCIRALDYAVQRGVIHRDIKPGNILYGADGDIKVSDFGASFQEMHSQETTQLSGVGSPAYMSPEQIRLDPLTHQTDIYSLGALLYKLLTGRLPYSASNPLSLTYEILNVNPVPPSTFRPDVPAVLDEICLRAMQKNPADRYQSWIEFGKDLSRAFGALRLQGATLSDSEKYTLLRSMSFFRDFDDVVLWEALRAAAWSDHPSESVIIREGDVGDGFFVLIRGEVAVTLEGSALASIEPGGCFGEMLYFLHHSAQRTTTITARTSVTIIEIKALAMRSASDACQVAFQKAFMRVLIDRLTQANRRVAHQSGGRAFQPLE